MSNFQLIALPLIAMLIAWSLIRLLKGRRPRWLQAASLATWLVAGAAIFRPELTSDVARFLGIGRGADLLSYVVALALVGSVFFLLNKIRRLEAEITILVREIALHTAEKPSDLPEADSPETASL
jgi:hypothetical protein